MAEALKSKYIVFAQDVKQAVSESEKGAAMLAAYDDTLLAVRSELSQAVVALQRKYKMLDTEKFTYSQRYEHCQRACQFNDEVGNSQECKDIKELKPAKKQEATANNNEV